MMQAYTDQSEPVQNADPGIAGNAAHPVEAALTWTGLRTAAPGLATRSRARSVGVGRLREIGGAARFRVLR
jgi:hypothetical protein